jgi:hypothetical protein
MYLLCVRRLALDGNCCFDVVMEELKGLRADGEPFLLPVFSGYIGYVLHFEGKDSQ